MKNPYQTRQTTITTYRFDSTEIEEILFKELGIEKTFNDSCTFECGQCFDEAVITIKRETQSENNYET